MRKAKRETAKDILAERKKRLESLAQVYIYDIHVMNVFLVWSHNEILGYLYQVGWYEMSYNKHNIRIRWPK